MTVGRKNCPLIGRNIEQREKERASWGDRDKEMQSDNYSYYDVIKTHYIHNKYLNNNNEDSRIVMIVELMIIKILLIAASVIVIVMIIMISVGVDHDPDTRLI